MKRTPLALAVLGALISQPLLADDLSGTKASAEATEVIVVSSSRSEKPLKDVAGSIAVVTAQDLEKQQPVDMSQLFQYEPGVVVTGEAGGAQNIVVRGMGADRVLMIKDGMRMNEGYGANGQNDIVGRGFIDLDLVKQVEVAKGAASSLYGSDALAGIVVFTTKDASDFLQQGESFGGAAKVSYSGLNSGTKSSATLALRAGDFEHLLHVGAGSSEEQENYEGSQQPFDYETDSLLYKAKWNLSETDSLTLMADSWKQETVGTRADGLLGYFRSLAQYGYQIVDENFAGEQEAQSLQLRYQSSAKTALYDQLDVSLYSNQTTQSDVEYGKLDINAPMFGVVEVRHMWETATYEQETQGLLTHAQKKFSSTQTLGFGVDFEQTESLRTEYEFRTVEGTEEPTKDALAHKFPKNEVTRAGAFINDEIKLADGAVVVTPGVRYDWYEMDPNGALKTDGTAFATIDESNLSFNLGALYYINERLSAYAQYGQGFKVPAYDLAYIEHDNSAYGYKVVPSDDLAPEQSDTYELGLRGHLGNFAFEAAIYRSEFSDFLQTALIGTETITVNGHGGPTEQVVETFQYQNIDSVTIEGAEFGVTYYLGEHWSLYANASYQDGKDDRTGDYIRSLSPLSGIVGAEFGTDNFSSNLVLNWAKGMTKVNEGEVETAGFVTLDWLASYQLADAVSLNLAVKNLLDKEYSRYESIAGSHAESDLSSKTEPGRYITASVKFHF